MNRVIHRLSAFTNSFYLVKQNAVVFRIRYISREVGDSPSMPRLLKLIVEPPKKNGFWRKA